MTATYMINKSPSVPLDGDVPQRVWTDKDVSYRHLKVFGCLADVLVAKDKRVKLDPKTRSCIFLAYDDDEFGYRLWDLAEKKVIRSCGIVFMEEKTIADWESEKKIVSSESTNRDKLDKSIIHLVGSGMSIEGHSELEALKQGTEPIEGMDIGTAQDSESDSDEE